MRRSPWPREIALVAGLGIVFAAALIIIATVLASGEAQFSHQISWVSVAITGLIVAAVCNVFFILSARQAMRARAMRLGGGVALDDEQRIMPLEHDGRLVAARAMTLYHRPDCILVQAKNVRAAARSLHERRGRKPCGVCRP